jgi:hypothetical protein
MKHLLNRTFPVWILFPCVLIYCLKFFHSTFLIQADVFPNLYFHHYANILREGWDPFMLGYSGLYPVFGKYFPTTALMHFIRSLISDRSPLITLTFLMCQVGALLCLLSLSAYAFFRYFDRSRTGSIVGAIIVTFTGFHVYGSVREFNIFFLISFLFVPWVIVFLDKAVRLQEWRWLAAGGMAFGLSLLGGTNSPLAWIIPTLPFIFLGMGQKSRGKKAFHGLAGAISVVSIGLGVAMVVVLPALIYSSYSLRDQGIWSQRLKQINYKFVFETFLFPDHKHGIIDPNSSYFLGFTTIFLVGIGIFSAFLSKTPQKGRAFMIFLGVYCLALIGISQFPEPFIRLYRLYSQVMALRVLSFRAGMPLLLSIGYFAALGVDSLQPRRRFQGYLAFLCFVFYIFAVQARLDSLEGFNQEVIRMASWLTVLFSAASMSFLIFWPKQKAPFVVFFFLTFYFSHPDIPFYKNHEAGKLTDQLSKLYWTPKNNFSNLIHGAQTPVRIYNMDLRQMNLWAPDLRLDVAWDPEMSYLYPKYLLDYLVTLNKSSIASKRTRNRVSPLFDLYGIEYVETADCEYLDLVPTKVHGICKNPRVFPRAFLSPSARYFHSLEDLFGAIKWASSSELRNTAYLIGKKEELPPDEKTNLQDKIQFVSRTPTRIELDVSSGQSNYLTLSETWFPAWKAKVDDKAVPLHQGYGTLWTILVPAGQHKIVFEFKEPWEKVGLGISFLTLAFCVICLIRRPQTA